MAFGARIRQTFDRTLQLMLYAGAEFTIFLVFAGSWAMLIALVAAPVPDVGARVPTVSTERRAGARKGWKTW